MIAKSVPAKSKAATTPKAANVVPLRKHYYMTEMGNADRFVDEHRDSVLFCPAYGWLVYRAGKWHRNCDHLVRTRINKTIRSMQAEAGQLEVLASKETEKEKREKLMAEAEELRRWARHSETEHMIKAMLYLAEPHLTVTADIFDTDPLLLNVKNGTLNLRTFQLQPHRREDYLMRQCGVDYDPNAQAPVHAGWLNQIMCGDQELVTYIQQIEAISLTGDTSEQKWFIGKGPGGNAKSTLVKLLQYILGDYALEISPDTITVSSFTRGGAEPAPDIVRMAGARFVVASETEQGARLKSALIKALVGGNTAITARDLYRSPFQFMPQFKLFLDTNHLPQVRDRGYAFWRRVRLIPFNYTVTKADPTIEDRLRAEGAGILAWMVQGLRDYLAAGHHLPACRAVDITTRQYQSDQDIIGMFLHEMCIEDRGAEQPSQELYNAFSEWVEQQMGERPMAQRSFTQALNELGYTSRRTKRGMVWDSIRLRGDYDPLPPEDDTPDRDDLPSTPVPNGDDTVTTQAEPAGLPAPVDDSATDYADLLQVIAPERQEVARVREAARAYHQAGRPAVTIRAPGRKMPYVRQGVPLFQELNHLAFTSEDDRLFAYAWDMFGKLATGSTDYASA